MNNLIQFACSKCASKLDVPADATGRVIQCPDCGAESVVPATKPKPPPPMPPPRPPVLIRFQCPSCGQQLKVESGAAPIERCPKCEVDLKARMSPSLPPPPPRSQKGVLDLPTEDREPVEDDDDPIESRRRERRSRTRLRFTALILCVGLILASAISVSAVFWAKYKKQQHAAELAKAELESKKKERPSSPPDEPSNSKKKTKTNPPKDQPPDPELQPRRPAPAPLDAPPVKPPEPRPMPAPPVVNPPVANPPVVAPPVVAPPADPKPDMLREQLLTLVKELKNKDAKLRLKAVESISALGKDAAPIAKELCDATFDSNANVARNAIVALEGVRPDLFKPLANVLLDKDLNVRMNGIRALGKLGNTARPVSGALMNLLKNSLGDRDLDQLSLHIFLAFNTIVPEDPDTVKSLKALAGPANPASGSRFQAMECLTHWAGVDEDRRKEMIPLVQAGLGDEKLMLACIKIAGAYGRLSKDLLPTLRKLKLSDSNLIRDAAIDAVKKIEE